MLTNDSCNIAILIAYITRHSKHAVELPVNREELIQHRKMLVEFICEFDGVLHEIKTGEIMASFNNASKAYAAAMSLSGLFDGYRIRAGLHAGKTFARQGKPQGATVNLTSRLPQYTRPGGVCLSGNVYRHLGHVEKAGLIELGTRALKNFRFGLPVYASLPDGELPRSRYSNLKRQVDNTLRTMGRYLPAVFFCTIVCLMVYNRNALSLQAENAVLSIYVPKFTHPHGKRVDVLESIEFSVRARVAGMRQVMLSSQPAQSDYALHVDVQNKGEHIEIAYVLQSLPDRMTSRSGMVEEKVSDLYALQDRLAKAILDDIESIQSR